MKVKIIDTFPFDGDWVLRMRLEFLFPHVDEFVITESWYTFSGEKKSVLYMDIWADILKEYKSKIHWIVVEDWHFQNHGHYQRDAAFSYIHEKYKGMEYIVNVGDVDEIPQVDIFHPDARQTMYAKLMEVKQPLYLEMIYFYYNFYWKKPYNWYKSYIISNDRLDENPSFSYWRDIHHPSLVLKQAGWHFHYFMEVSDIQRRVQTDTGPVNSSHIKECIAHGIDIFHSDERLIHDDKTTLPPPLGSFRGELDYLQLA